MSPDSARYLSLWIMVSTRTVPFTSGSTAPGYLVVSSSTSSTLNQELTNNLIPPWDEAMRLPVTDQVPAGPPGVGRPGMQGRTVDF